MRIAAAVALALFLVSAIAVCFSQAAFRYDANDKRDPFIPLVDKSGNLLPEFRPAGSQIELNLEGIVFSDKGDSYALISGEVLRAGDSIGDYKVIKIERNKVVLNRAGEEFVLNLRGEEE